MKRNNKKTGRRGEQAAMEQLAKEGYEILATNYGNKWGEIDIVAKQGEYRIFVEVKTKRGDSYGEPWEMINANKIKRVENMGQLWCNEFAWEGLCRVDVVGVWMDQAGEITKIKHWKNVQL